MRLHQLHHYWQMMLVSLHMSRQCKYSNHCILRPNHVPMGFGPWDRRSGCDWGQHETIKDERTGCLATPKAIGGPPQQWVLQPAPRNPDTQSLLAVPCPDCPQLWLSCALMCVVVWPMEALWNLLPDLTPSLAVMHTGSYSSLSWRPMTLVLQDPLPGQSQAPTLTYSSLSQGGL